MASFGHRALGCVLSGVLCWSSACAVQSETSAQEETSSAHIGGTVSVAAQVSRSYARTFLPASLKVEQGQAPQASMEHYGLVAQQYVKQGAAFAVSAIALIDNIQAQEVTCDERVIDSACTRRGWVHVIPMFDDRASAVASPYAGGFWLRAEDVLLVQVSGPVLNPERAGRLVQVEEAREILSGITRLSETRGEPFGTIARPLDAVAYSAPRADGSFFQIERNGFWDLTVGASMDPNDANTGWVVRGVDGYLLKSHAVVCSAGRSEDCAAWEALDNSVLGAGVSGRAVIGGIIVAVVLVIALSLFLRNRKRDVTIEVADATAVSPLLDPGLSITATPPAPTALPTTAPLPPAETDPEIRMCWAPENLMCRYTFYQNVWYCLCLRPSSLAYEGGLECGNLDFRRGTWDDGCAIHPRDLSEMGNPCWFPNECASDAWFHNNL